MYCLMSALSTKAASIFSVMLEVVRITTLECLVWTRQGPHAGTQSPQCPSDCHARQLALQGCCSGCPARRSQLALDLVRTSLCTQPLCLSKDPLVPALRPAHPQAHSGQAGVALAPPQTQASATSATQCTKLFHPNFCFVFLTLEMN